MQPVGIAAVQVLVATAPMCWGMTVAAQLVIVMGTQYYDSQGATGGEDYPVSDLLQMMGRASRPDIDHAGRCIAHPSEFLPHTALPLSVCLLSRLDLTVPHDIVTVLQPWGPWLLHASQRGQRVVAEHGSRWTGSTLLSPAMASLVRPSCIL